MPTATRRILLAAVAVGILFDILAIGNAAGINASILMAAFLVVAFAVAGRAGVARMDPADAWLAPVALALAGLVAIRADDWLVTADLLLAAALAAGAVGCLAGGRITRGLVPQVLDLSVGLVTSGAVGTAGLLLRPGPHGDPVPGPGRGRLARVRRAAPVVRGLLIAIPIVLVFGALFASADAVFARLANDVLAWQPDLDVADLAGRAIVVTLVAWGAAGLLALSAGLLPSMVHPFTPSAGTPGTPAWIPVTSPAGAPGEPGHVAAPSAAGAPGPMPPPAPSTWAAPGQAATAAWPSTPTVAQPRHLRLGTVEAATILLVVDALFAVFVGLQLAYLFGGRDTLALSGITYAEYARRGFFELVIVAMLAGTLVVALHAATDGRSRWLLGASLALLGLTAIVLLSALLRLRLYQEAYGWTELRFVVLTAILWLGAALAIAAVLLVTDRTRWILHALGIGALVTVAAMNLVGPQAFVAQRNLERAIDPGLVPPGGRTGLDAAYLAELSDEAVEPIVDAWSRLPLVDRIALRPVLLERSAALAGPDVTGWPSWNLTRERARAAIERWDAGG
jgi:hypothetical protein